jgi:hypothetical protein
MLATDEPRELIGMQRPFELLANEQIAPRVGTSTRANLYNEPKLRKKISGKQFPCIRVNLAPIDHR